MDNSDVHAKGQRSRSQRSKQFLSQFERLRNVTPVWIHRWLRNDAQSLKWHRTGALLFFEVIRQISRSHGQKKNQGFGPDLSVFGWQLQFEFMDGNEMTHIAFRGMEEVPCCFSKSSIKFEGHTGWKIYLDLIWDYKACRSYQIPQISLLVFRYYLNKWWLYMNWTLLN